MAKFPPKLIIALQNTRLRMDLEDLQNAYRSSLKGLIHREGEIEAMARAELGIGPGDDWPERNDDDPDDPIGALYDHAGDLDAQAQRGAPMVRKAFLIALFHAWERHLNARLKREQYDHQVARKTIIRDGHAAHWKSIRELHLAANCAKHGPGDSCSDLYAMRPDFFPRVQTAEKAGNAMPKIEPSEATLVIIDDTLSVFFDAVVLA